MNKKKHYADNKLILGENDKRNEVFIQEENRLKHLLVIGTKGSAKSTGVLPVLAKQDFEEKKHGTTIIVGEKESAMLLYALAKREKRDVVIIKPSLTDSGKLLLAKKRYDYDAISRDVVDFGKAILKRQVVIVDMEFVHNGQQAIRSVAYLLTALQEAMVRENESGAMKHYLYVDNAHLYMPFMKTVLSEGHSYGVGCTLFLESRQQLAGTGELALLDANVRNHVVMSGLTIEDVEHYERVIYEKQKTFILNRPKVEFIYLTMDKEGRRAPGNGKFQFLGEDVMQSLRMSIPRYRGNIEREQVGVESVTEPAKERLQLVKEVGQSTPLPQTAQVEAPVKNAVKPPVNPLVIKPKRDRVTEEADRNSKRHVIIVDDLFDADEEF